MSKPLNVKVPATPPLVLCLSGLDPTGGAGLQADIESCAAQGARALPVLTANTVQDTQDVRRVVATAPILLAQQLRALLDDCEIAAVKIGLLGDVQQIPVIADVLRAAGRPVVLDPVLRAGGGSNLVGAQLQAALLTDLLPLTTVLTPNAAEARRLAPGSADAAAAAATLLDAGCAHVLITGGDEPGPQVVNTWYRAAQAPQRFEWPRLAGPFHGAGCTLAAAVAARLARGEAMTEALSAAQAYTHQCLQRAVRVGAGRLIPQRLP
jgi:hydroxymethylpyrimidine/phosphomethylpyrimidine kinase